MSYSILQEMAEVLQNKKMIFTFKHFTNFNG
jgi:hypothetical protein